MMRNLLFAVVLAAAGPAWALDGHGPPRGAALPDCAGRQLTHLPFDPDTLEQIVPLGNVAPPGHVLPTEHMYMFRKHDSLQEVRAPGDGWILRLSGNRDLDGGQEDFGFQFAPCRDLYLYMLHLTEPREDLARTLEAGRCRDTGHLADGERYRYCDARTAVKVKAGELIGRVTRGHSFDMGAYDERSRLAHVEPNHYRSRSPHIVCPLDLFAPEPRAALYAKVGRQAEPRCGRVMQDVPGTLAGNWFAGEAYTDRNDHWGRMLSFVEHNQDPAEGVVGIGGTVSSPARLQFRLRDEGRINRRFEQVSTDGQVYCFQGAEPGGDRGGDRGGSVLVRMLDARTIEVERKVAECGGDARLSQPVRYER